VRKHGFNLGSGKDSKLSQYQRYRSTVKFSDIGGLISQYLLISIVDGIGDGNEN
jgi:hypothetical protein